MAQADVAHDRALDLLELDARLQVGERDRPSRPRVGIARPGTISGSATKRALEGGEAEPAAEREVGRRVDGGGDEDEVAAVQRGDPRAQAVGAVGGQVELDAPGDVQQRLDAGPIGHAVEDDARAPLDELADRLDELLVGALGGRHLEDDAVGADRHRADPQQQVAADRQPRDVAAGERLRPTSERASTMTAAPSTSSS